MMSWNRRTSRTSTNCFRGPEGLVGHARVSETFELRSHPPHGLDQRVDEIFADMALRFDDDDDDPGASGRLVPSG